MKFMVSIIACSLLSIPLHAAQALAQGIIKRDGDALDIAANVSVSGTVQAPLTVHIPAETQSTLKALAIEVSAIGYGIGLIASGTRELIGNNKPTPTKEYLLEAGLSKRSPKLASQSIQNAPPALASDPLLLDEDKQPKKSCCSRLISSRGLRQIFAGWWFIGSGLSLELLRK